MTIEDPGTMSNKMIPADEEENQEMQKDLETQRTATNEKEAGQQAAGAPWRVDTRVRAVGTAETQVGGQRRTRAWR